MITTKKLQLFGLTSNQSKILEFFIKNRERSDLTFRIMRAEIKPKKSLYREVLLDLIEKKFLYALKDRRPLTYHLNENRFQEILIENQNSFFQKQQKLEKILTNIKSGGLKVKKDSKTVLKFLNTAKVELRLSDDQILILDALFSNINGNESPTAMNPRQISKMLGQNDITKIRYNLTLLEKRGFVVQQKIGRINYYYAIDIAEIFQIEKKFQKHYWNDKKKQMEEIISILEEKPEKKPDEFANFVAQNSLKNIKDEMINFIKEARDEIIFDFRCNFERVEPVREFLREIFESILEILNTNDEIFVKLLLNIDDWLIHKLDFVFIQLIEEINPKKFEFRVPIDIKDKEFNLITDTHKVFFILGVTELSDNEIVSEVNIKKTAIELKRKFNRVWQNSIDIRDAIFDYKIGRNLEKVIEKSVAKYPPEYNFTDRFITITGLRKGLRILLHLYDNAKSEILTILGPVFPSRRGTFSAFEELAKENFFEKLNQVLYRGMKINLNVKWLRNTSSNPHLRIYRNDELKRAFIDSTLSLYPRGQMKQISLEEYQFSIIDQKLLFIMEYSDPANLTITLDDFIIDEYNLLFKKLWEEAYDIRLQWLSELTDPLDKYVKNSFNQIELQISLPEEGETKKFDGRYFNPILYFFFNKILKDIYKTHNILLLSNLKRDPIISNIIKNIEDYMKFIENPKVKIKIITKYFPRFVNEISDTDLKSIIDLYPTFEFNFLTEHIKPNSLYILFDNYVLSLVGELDSENSQIIIMNDENLRMYYNDLFNSLWENSIDLRQIFYEYGSPKIKKFINLSINKFGITKKVNSNQIKDMFPLN